MEVALTVDERHDCDEKIQADIRKDTMSLGLGAPCWGTAPVYFGGCRPVIRNAADGMTPATPKVLSTPLDPRPQEGERVRVRGDMRDLGPHILIVDDDPAVIEALTAALKGSYVVHGAATGKEACGILRTRPIVGIVLDAILGPEHGLDLVERFRTLSPAPILLLTGYGSEELAIRAVWAKVDGYLKKPPNVPQVQAALARLAPHNGLPADPLEWVRARIAQDCTRAVPIDELARAAGRHPDSLRRAFTDRFAVSPHAYQEACRMQQAATLLRETGRQIKEVAWQVGFRDATTFSAAFKRFHGISPLAFRSRHRPDPGQTGSG